MTCTLVYLISRPCEPAEAVAGSCSEPAGSSSSSETRAEIRVVSTGKALKIQPLQKYKKNCKNTYTQNPNKERRGENSKTTKENPLSETFQQQIFSKAGGQSLLLLW